MRQYQEDATSYRQALYARTPFSSGAQDVLWYSKVGVVGAGSGGSSIALEIARAGVGEIRISDTEVLTLANLSRHELGLSFLDKNKAAGVAARIRDINPYIKVMPFACNLFDSKAKMSREQFFDGLDQVIACTDKISIQLAINREAVERGLPAVFGGCYESAIGGEVLYWLPGLNVPCLECLRGGLPQPEKRSDVDYSTANGPEDYEGEPGLHAAIELISNIEVEIALAVLLRNEASSTLGKLLNAKRTFLLIGGSRAEGFYRFRKNYDIFWQPLNGPRIDCGSCQSKDTKPGRDLARTISKLEVVPDGLRRYV